MTPEQIELMEKLNCLEFETAQLNHAYQLWKSDVEQGTAPDWMIAAIRATYDALITFCLDTASALAASQGNEDESVSGDDTTFPLRRALPAGDSITASRSRHSRQLRYDDADPDPGTRSTALVDGSLALNPLRQSRIMGMLTLAEVPRVFSANQLAQLESAACEISGVLGEETSTAEPYPELLPVTRPAWSRPELSVIISAPSARDAVPEQPVIQQGQPENKTEAEPAAVRSVATLRLPNWLRGSSSGRLFGAASVAILASVIILMVAGGAVGMYVMSPRRAASRHDVRLATTGAVAIPTGEKAGFKFDPDPVVAPQGRSFVLNAVLSRGSDIASMAAEIDYDANLLEFTGVSEGGFLAKAGPRFVVAQRDDPSTGVLKISADQSPGSPGISGDGPVFALSFHARKNGDGIVSIVPTAHDSQGRRIALAGSQVSVRLN